MYIGPARYYSDYYPGPYVVTFPAGVTTASISIFIIDDSTLELIDETFFLVINDLLLPKHITYGDLWRATVTIVSNESKCVVKFTDKADGSTMAAIAMIIPNFQWPGLVLSLPADKSHCNNLTL